MTAPSHLAVEDLVSPAPRWVGEAACGFTDPEMFFDEGQEAVNATRTISKENVQRRAKAKSICYSCPVLRQCREHFINELHGVYGGLDRDERRALREARSALAGTGVDTNALGREAYVLFREGRSLSALGKQHNLMPRQLRMYLDNYLLTPEGQRAQLEYEIKSACENGLDDREVAIKLDIPISKVTYIRRRLGLVERRLSEATPKLDRTAPTGTYAFVGGLVVRAMYLGESEDDPPMYFMRFKTPQAFTRKWMQADQVRLGTGVQRHVIAKGVGSGIKRLGRAKDQGEVA